MGLVAGPPTADAGTQTDISIRNEACEILENLASMSESTRLQLCNLIEEFAGWPDCMICRVMAVVETTMEVVRSAFESGYTARQYEEPD